MKSAINQPVYYVPSVRLREDLDISYSPVPLKEGQEYPIANDTSCINYNPDEVSIMVHTEYACNIVSVPVKRVDMFVKRIIPKFQLGQVVTRLDGKQPYRIFQYCLSQGRVWYRNGWSVATNCEAGRTESELKEATKEVAESWEIDYNDNLVRDKYPQMYASIVGLRKSQLQS